jgi:DNA mismatch endonuclease (patch repair protein)
VAVFVDGCFWHSCPEHGNQPANNREYWSAKLARNTVRDAANTATLEEAGWLVVRIWEHERPAEAAARIRHVVLLRRG